MGMMLAAASAAPAQGFITLLSFNSANGASPYAALIQATDGNLYGTTPIGGAYDDGTVFRITPSGVLTTLHSFDGYDGAYSYAGLVQATDGNFYGTTWGGGASSLGAIFKIDPTGTLTTLHSFSGPDGANPLATLVQGTDGSLYGTTITGGRYISCDLRFGDGCGTVFKITLNGSITTLYSFCAQSSCTDGFYPGAGLVQGADGNFYGTTADGGAGSACTGGCGTIFKITAAGVLTTLYAFDYADGYQPLTALLQATDGNFYGTTLDGGTNDSCNFGAGCGTVFKVTPSGILTTLYSFCSQSGCTDGDSPEGALVQATDGNLYGTTVDGGVINSYGTLFKLTPSGMLTTLHRFCAQSGCADGEYPVVAVVQDTNGKLYGTAAAGGVHGDGTVFTLSEGFGVFVETQPTFGEGGSTIKILGTNLRGATSVTFNGTPAVFKVISPTEIGPLCPPARPAARSR